MDRFAGGSSDRTHRERFRGGFSDTIETFGPVLSRQLAIEIRKGLELTLTIGTA